MADDSVISPQEWPLERQCDFISRVYGLWNSGLTVVTFAEKGEGPLAQFRYNTLHMHQRALFLDGLRKLGIDPKREPPAVVAGKYHFFSNALGGLDMEYVEVSPKKVWVRYNAPFGPVGTGWLAIPPSSGRVIFAAWHSYNGELLDCPRLGFVLARGFSEGEPYAEGYFQEYDYDLKPEEWIKYDLAATMPEFDPEKAPKLDPEAWPLERRAKAKRNFARGYVEEAITSMLQLFGVPSTTHIISRAFQGIATQYGKELLAELDIRDTSARSLAYFTKILSDMAGDSVDIDSSEPGRHIVRRTHRRLFPPGQVPVEIHRAMFSFTTMMARVMSRRIKASLTTLQDEGAPYDEMVFEDINQLPS
ncbi:MAG: hypothetical protein ACE5JL_01910 [Dehalococcoidia bacterium]